MPSDYFQNDKRKRRKGVVSSGSIADKLMGMQQQGAQLMSPAQGQQSMYLQPDLPAPPQQGKQIKMPAEDFSDRYWEAQARFAKNLLGG